MALGALSLTDWHRASDIIAQGVTLRGGRGLTLWSKPL